MKHLVVLLTILSLASCKPTPSSKDDKHLSKESTFVTKFSLAQWVYHKAIFAGEMSTKDFVLTASEMGFVGVDYVDQLIADKVNNIPALKDLRRFTDSLNIKNVMIMIDLTGKHCDASESERRATAAKTKKWIDAAVILGCESIRVNAHGDGSPEEMHTQCVDGIGEVAKYAKEKGIILTIENHGGISSDGAWLANLIDALQVHDVASFPDFGNWCIERENGQLWGAPCVKHYDAMKGLYELLPTAKAMSLKSHAFDEQGNEETMDYRAIFKAIIESGYSGFLSCEYEGEDLSPKEGTIKTRELVKKSIADFYRK